MDLNSEEHRAALAARKERPTGSHIHDPSSGEPPGYDVRGEFVDPLLLVLRALDNLKPKEAEVNIPKQRFDWTINTGNVLVIIAMLIGFGSAYVGWTQSITVMQEAIKQAQHDIQANTEADRLRVDKYAPRIEKVETLIQSIVPRQDNQGDNMRDIRNAIADLIKVTSQMHEDMAVMKMQFDRKPSGPHSEIERPSARERASAAEQ